MKKPSDATWYVLKKSKKYIFWKIIISIIYRGIIMITPIIFGAAVDMVTGGKYREAILISLVGVLAVVLFRINDIVNTYSWHKMYNCIYDNYTKLGVNKVFDNSLHSLSRFNIGEFLNIMSTDINIIADFYCQLVMRVIRIFEVLIIFVYFFMIDFYIGIAGLVMGFISLIIILLSSKTIERLNRTKAYAFDRRNTIINEFLLSIREIKAFNIFEPIKKRITNSTEEYTKKYLNQRVGEDSFKFSILAFIEAFRWGLFIYGIYLISIGKMEMGSLVIIYNYFAQLIEGFSEFTTINVGLRQLKVSENRFYQLVIYSNDKLMLDNKSRLNSYNIKFRDVVYGDKENPRLKGVSFDIKSKSINAITGLVGAGKSGTVDLLLKLNRQHSGDITIGGTDINDISFDPYYGLVSCIDKDDRFLNISIKENLLFVKDNFEEIVFICKKLGIHDEILKLKNGYDTVLNSNEDTLKQNTKVLLNVARILLKDTRVMIFDSVLYLLNKESKRIVLDILNEIKDKHTIIIISKDDEVLSVADSIILLDEGRVYNTGEYDNISNLKLYKQIVEN